MHAIGACIRASHFVAISSVPSFDTRFDGSLIRERRGLQDSTSLSLFCDDICLLLCDLYGDNQGEALDQLHSALLAILISQPCCVAEDLLSEHSDAKDVDYYLELIERPEGHGKSGSEHGYGLAALERLRGRVRNVRENPTAFSKYTVQFSEAFAERWKIDPVPTEILEDDLDFLYGDLVI